MTKTNIPRLANYYQPIPFDEYYSMTAQRVDCDKRYQVIKDSYGKVAGKSLVDFGCAEGYFMWRFIQDGGAYAHGIESDTSKVDFINELASIKNIKVRAATFMCPRHYDIGIYLDLYGDSQKSVDVFDDICKQCSVIFVSRSGCEGDGRHEKLVDHIKQNDLTYSTLYKGFSGREILRCDK